MRDAPAAVPREREFGPYGGRFVPETLIPALEELEREWIAACADPEFRARLGSLLADYAGRPTPLYHAARLSEVCSATVYLKREDLLHTGAHKINNALGQALLARRMGKPRVIAETGAGQHGVATATACALLGLECVVYMGSEDMRRQRPNVERMGLLGAEVVPVEAGARTLKEAVSAAIRDWVANVATTHYVIGSAVGPAPYPGLVRDLQRVIGEETRRQIEAVEGRLPDRVIACVGGGSNAIGAFVPFVSDTQVDLVGVEAAELRPGFAPDDRLKLPHDRRVGVRAERRAQDVMGRGDVLGPVAHRFVDRVLERPRAGVDRDHLGAQQPHARDVRRLPLHVDGAHVDAARHAESRRRRRRRDPVLPRARFRDDARLAHPPRQQHLAEGVVELVRASMEQVFALEDDPRPAPFLREPRRLGQRRGPAAVRLEKLPEFALETSVAPETREGPLELFERSHERLGSEAPAVVAVVARARLPRLWHPPAGPPRRSAAASAGP